MKLKNEFVIHMSNGLQHIVDTSGKFNGLITGNETSAFIIDMLKDDTTEEKIISAMLDKYDAPEDKIRNDVKNIISKLRSVGAIYG